METFLNIVAKELYAKHGDDLSRIAVVFPNKRAGLFFNEHLTAQSEQPLWSPAYLSISELLQSLSSLHLADPIQLVCELYTVFKEKTNSTETLDDFYFWGEMLISDFDDVDKNLVDADKLFRNLKELNEIMDDFDFLDEEQRAAIQQFFSNFSIEKRTELKERFASIWHALGDIYTDFHRALTSQGVAYEGMLYRDAINKLNTDNLPYDKYVFAGFNVLNKVEWQLFHRLQQAGKALFYWDYDHFYVTSEGKEACKHEAGIFIRKNLIDFPSQLDTNSFDNLSKPKTVRYISASTENAQARYLPQWIRNNLTENEKESAVVLCNEALLLPVLHSIPKEVNNANITMGFPLSQTPSYTFIDILLELQISGYDSKEGRYTFAEVKTVLKHPYTQSLSRNAEALKKELTEKNRFYPTPSELHRDEFLSLLFTPCSNIAELCRYITKLLKRVTVLYQQKDEVEDVFGQLYRESLFKSYTTINRMVSLIENGSLNIRIDTLKRLIQRLLSATNIPFHGEPAIGLQIMGVLETRNLDFKNLIVLSLNEGLLPKGGGEASFIPYNLRKAFGMTTIEHRDALYAYYFYRLIQRAENVTLVYNTSSDGLNRGEASRFLLQFQIEWPHPVAKQFLEAGQSPQVQGAITVEKTPEVMDKLYRLYSRDHGSTSNISPSALNAYLDCRLRFYFRYIAGLKLPKEVSTEIDSPAFGTIFHKVAELIYNKLTERGTLIRKEDIETLLKDKTIIQQYVDIAFKEEFFHIKEEDKVEYNGIQLINAKVIATYMRQLLKSDLGYAPFHMVGMEKKVYENIFIDTPTGKIKTAIGGTIDRLDSKNGTLRIVDYKTGGTAKIPKNIDQLFTRHKDRANYVFQTFIYASIMCSKQDLKIAPSIFYINRAASENYSPVIEMGEARQPKIPVDDFSLLNDEFREHLQLLLEEIYNPEIAFDQVEDVNSCEWCDYKGICKRG